METHVILVAGAHRSRTSLLARQIAAANVPFGEHLLHADQSNVSGYIEDRPVVEFHTLLLQRGGRTWLSAGDSSLSHVREKDRSFIRRYAAARSKGQACWAIKDPRLSIFAPVWRQEVPKARLLAVFRSPADVKRSILLRASQNRRKVLEAPTLSALRNNPDLPVMMWLNYNRTLIRQWQESPAEVSLVGSNSLRYDSTLPTLISDRWGMPLNFEGSASLYDTSAQPHTQEPLTVTTPELEDAVQTTWHDLCRIERQCLGGQSTHGQDELQIKLADQSEIALQPISPSRLVTAKMAIWVDHLCQRTRHRTYNRSLRQTVGNSRAH